jgi:hypothetical protein
MRYTGTWTIALAAVAAVTLAWSGGAWAQQAKNGGTSASAAAKECVMVKGGGCVTSKGGTELTFKSAGPAKPASSEAANGKQQPQSAAK